MLVTSLLAAAVIFALLYGAVSWPVLAGALALAPAFYFLGKSHGHDHGGYLSIDYYAQASGLNRLNPGLKLGSFVLFLFVCVAADSALAALVIAAAMICLTLWRGRTPVRVYLSLLLVPASFILLSSAAIIFSLSPEPLGLLDLPLPGALWLSATAAGRRSALLLMAKAFGGLSCMYALSLSTPMAELIGALRRLKLPAIVIELMYLIYRYIFILIDLRQRMQTACRARLGEDGWRNSWRSFGGIASNLLVLSFKRASASFDAMEARCYDGELRFLERPKPVLARDLAWPALALAGTGLLLLWEKTGGF